MYNLKNTIPEFDCEYFGKHSAFTGYKLVHLMECDIFAASHVCANF